MDNGGQTQGVVAPIEANAGFFVVGLGASAGGLEALEQFFDNVRADCGMAFVVIQHLSPDFKSLMDELLRRHTEMAIHRVENGMLVEPNSIYLIPPRKEMIISEGRLLLTDKDPSHGLTLPIDTFLRSLAQDVGERAIGIILSGTGSDGSRGIRAVHEAGGLVIVQDQDTAKFDGMPRNAVDTGVVDLILAPQEMPAALVQYVNQPHGRLTGDRLASAEPGQGVEAIFQLLRQEYGLDFSHYKPSTVGRRIERRLLLNRSNSLDDYIQRLASDPGELNALYRDLLIGVTKFFRDHEAFERLEKEIIPHLAAESSRHDEIRVWVAGCATGEEAYSLAILLHEQLSHTGRHENVKIFATDVHRASLDVASAGFYSEAGLSEVTPTRLQRYFVRKGTGFQISPELRRMIVFAPHNLVRDAPFTKLDLISCRNLLIYLQPLAQKKVLSLFQFSLKTGGILFLGPSESPGDLAEEFDTLDNQWKLYRKRRDVHLAADMRLPLSAGFTGLRPVMPRLPSPDLSVADGQLIRVYDAVLESYIPPSFLLNSRRELVHSFAGAGRFLRIRDGRHTLDVLDMVDEELRIPLAGALQRCAKQNATVVYKSLALPGLGQGGRVRLVVRPIVRRGGGNEYTLVSFEDISADAPPPRDESEIDMGEASRERLQSLEDELRYTKENLQATIEELETSNEELQATNEELVASNEELQSTNEELHSVNEELYTVNAEYQRKIAELTEMTDDMDNLLQSTDVGVMFLDQDLCIRKFTAKMADFFDLLPQDVGRRISTFTHRIAYDGFLEDIETVLATQQPVEREVKDQVGNALLLRTLPYRSKSRLEGAVVTIFDISLMKRAETQLRLMSKVFMDGADPIIIEDLTGRIIDLNAEAERVYGWNRDELLDQRIELLWPEDERGAAQQLRTRCRNADHVRNVEAVRRTKSGETHPVLLTLSLLADESGQPVGIATIAKDITALKRAEEEAQTAVKRRDQFLAILSHELRNPLSAVLNAGSLITHQGLDHDTLRRACQVIDRQSKHMARLLDDLLDVSRVAQSKIQLHIESCDLAAAFNEALESVQCLVHERGHRLSIELPRDPVFVEGDPARLRQICENLLGNAVKYTPPGGEISVSVQSERDEAVLRVRDTGYGIPPEMLDSIFELFVQSPTSIGQGEGGMGVGLTLVRDLVRLHGGRVVAKSDGSGCGSEFMVWLPLSRERPHAPPAAPPVPHREGTLHVLIVEDNHDSCDMLKSLLELEGYVVDTADDGRRGLDKILNQTPDVALVDIGLPGLDGYELARQVRSRLSPEQVTLIALTGFGRAEDRQAVLAAGFDQHLVKPVGSAELFRALHG